MSARGRHLGYVLKRFPRISETFVAAEIIELERQGERVTVFALSKPDEPFAHAFIREMKARVVYLPRQPFREPVRVANALARVVRGNRRGWLRAAAANLWPPFSGVRHLLQATVLRDEIERSGVDHVHAHFASTATRLAHHAWLMGGPSYSVTAHAKDIYHRDVRVDRLRERLSSAAFVATVSAANRDYLRSIVDGRTRLQVVPNAVDLDRLGPARRSGPNAGSILAVARLVEKKGLADLVAACGLLSRRGVDVRLDVVGDGPLKRALMRAAAAYGAPVVFHGALPHEQVLDRYLDAAVFCLPCVVASTGDRDGLPTAVLEAMATGVPVVTTSVNGLGELVVDGESGLVVPEHDPVALANALGRVLGDRVLAGRLAAGGRHLVERRFSLSRSVADLRALFAEAA